MCGSPRLIAACHVLLRLLMPRHSPCALYSLTYFSFQRHWFSQELCRPQIWFIVVFVLPYFLKFHNYNSVTSLLLARNFLLASLFSFQGAGSNLLQGQIEMLRRLPKHFNPISLVEVIGFEPVTPCLQSRCSTN